MTDTFFKIPDLKRRLIKDLTDFNVSYDTQAIFGTNLVSRFDALNSTNFDNIANKFVNEIKTLMRKIVEQMKLPQKSTYLYTVNKTDNTKTGYLQTLWILRTYLFYYVLGFAVVIIKNEAMYKIVKDSLKKSQVTIDDWELRMQSEIDNFKLGIFGSQTASSDIDVGIQHCGKNPVPGLAYIIILVENLFIWATGSNCLTFDIEFYGNITFLYDSKRKTDFYYLDLKPFNLSIFLKLLPYSMASIYRNQRLSDPNMTIEDDFDKWLENILNRQLFLKNEQLSNLFKTKHWFTDQVKTRSLTLFKAVDSYLVGTYASKQTLYCNALRKADEHRMNGDENSINSKALQFLDCKLGDNVNCKDITQRETLEVLVRESYANLLREESYVLPMSVMIVVRTLQIHSKECKQSPQNEELELECFKKYVNTAVECKTFEDARKNAYCEVGIFSYYLCIFEQIGYLLRFEGYNNKLSKYQKRVTHAFQAIETLMPRKKGGAPKVRKTRRRANTRMRRVNLIKMRRRIASQRLIRNRLMSIR